RTARVAPITCVSCGIIGNVIAQRYIPGGNGKRKWRLLSSPVNISNSIAYNQLIDDIIITGQGGNLNGFDDSPQNSYSVKTYTESVPGSSSNGWTFPTSINS